MLQWRRLSEGSSRTDILNNNLNYIDNRSNNTFAFDNFSSDLDSISSSSLDTGNINGAMVDGNNDGDYQSDNSKADIENINPLQYDSRNYAIDDLKNNNCTDKNVHGSPLNSSSHNKVDQDSCKWDDGRKTIDKSNDGICFNETFKDNIFKETDSILCNDSSQNYNDLGDLLFNHQDNMLDPFDPSQPDTFHTPPNDLLYTPHLPDPFTHDAHVENNNYDNIDVNNNDNLTRDTVSHCILEIDKLNESCFRGEGDHSKNSDRHNTEDSFYSVDEIDEIIQILAEKRWVASDIDFCFEIL